MRALDGSYRLASDGAAAGQLVAGVAAGLEPSFARASWWRVDATALVLSSNLGLAYIAHYNAPAYYRSLTRRSRSRFARVVAIAFGVLSLLYVGIMLLGYTTFGDNTASNLLRNYAGADTLAVLGRVATFVSILFGYPLAMVGLRESSSSVLLALSALRSLPPPLASAVRAAATNTKGLTIALLAIATAIAITLDDIGLVVGVSGALLGAAIVYVFPALIYGRAVDAPLASAVHALIPLGATLGILGVRQTLS